MKALVVGTDYFADRFSYLIEKENIRIEKLSKLPKELNYDFVFLSGSACTIENIKTSISRGMHVFSEQIIFNSESDISFIDQAKKRRLKLYIGSFDIFNPVIKKIKELIRNQDILSMRLDRVGPVSYSNINIIEDSVIHGIGTLNYILGGKNKTIKIISHVSENGQFTLALRIGDVNTIIYSSNRNQYKERIIDVFCRSMRMRGDIVRQELYVLDSRKDDPNLCETGVWSFRRYYVKKQEPLETLIKGFLKEENPIDYGSIRQVLKAAFKTKSLLLGFQ